MRGKSALLLTARLHLHVTHKGRIVLFVCRPDDGQLALTPGNDPNHISCNAMCTASPGCKAPGSSNGWL